jgi:hypothetical protein
MVNPNELAICKRRGHEAGMDLRHGWIQCRWCGVWVREVVTLEEREEIPPEGEKNPLPGLGIRLKKLSVGAGLDPSTPSMS